MIASIANEFNKPTLTLPQATPANVTATSKHVNLTKHLQYGPTQSSAVVSGTTRPNG